MGTGKHGAPIAHPTAVPDVPSRDACRIERALERFCRDDPAIRRSLDALLRAQTTLRGLLTAAEWRVYLVVSDRANAHHDALIDAAITVAFRQGIKAGRRRRER
jgi:hypothetical protein